MTDISAKYNALKSILQDYGKVIIALSGGLDSSFLLFAALDSIGKQNTCAAIGVSPSLASAERDAARQFAESIGLDDSHIIMVDTAELEDENYRRNAPDRCFFCKQELFTKLNKLANEYGNAVVCDGANASDIGDHRPGRKAASELKVKSPLLEAELDKEEIRSLAKQFGLSIWDKPQSACLASRIPYDSEVTEEKLKQVEEAEAYLKSLGLRQLRVRHHGNLARIELLPDDMSRILSNGSSKKIVARFREIGFLFTTIDIAGFRSGSMNIMLKGENND